MPKFSPKKISIILDDPEEAENFLRGLIIAKSNNSSPFFPQLLDATNAVLEEYRGELLAEQMEARSEAGMP